MKQTQVLFLELSGIFFKYFLPICGFKLKPSMENSERDEVAKGQVPLWPASWETFMQVRKQQLELDMEQQTGSK